MTSIRNVQLNVLPRGLLKDNCNATFSTATKVLDAGGYPMIVGEMYEMYAPAAKRAAELTGLVWALPAYTFKYAGTLECGDNVMILSADVSYSATGASAAVYAASVTLREKLGGLSPLCPTRTAKFIRPLTDG